MSNYFFSAKWHYEQAKEKGKEHRFSTSELLYWHANMSMAGALLSIAECLNEYMQPIRQEQERRRAQDFEDKQFRTQNHPVIQAVEATTVSVRAKRALFRASLFGGEFPETVADFVDELYKEYGGKVGELREIGKGAIAQLREAFPLEVKEP